MVSSLNNSDFNNTISSLLQMKTTSSLVKTVTQEYIKQAQEANNEETEQEASSKSSSSKTTTSSTKVTSSSESSVSPNEEKMDYNEDGKVSISERIRYYTGQLSEKLSKNYESSSDSSDKLSREDYASVGMKDYFDLQQKLGVSAYINNMNWENARNYSSFSISV